MSLFKKATKTQIKLRLALTGPSGAGKTYSSLALASHLGKGIALVDTEKGSASRYADIFEFDVLELESFHPTKYIQAICAAEQAGYDVLIIDSLSHCWMGKDGALDLVDRAKNSFAAWKDVRPLERALIDAILGCQCHLIATMRSKTEWVVETNDKGKAEPRRVGTAPIQTQGIEFEFDIAAELNLQNTLTVTKSRCPALSGKVFVQPGKQVADIRKQWLDSGAATVVVTQANGHNSSALTNTVETEATTSIKDNPNRDLLKRIGQITGHSSKQIAAILETNFPERKSNSLNDLEVRAMVDAICTDVALQGGMEESKARAAFSKWLSQQHPEIGNEELAQGWMSQIEMLMF